VPAERDVEILIANTLLSPNFLKFVPLTEGFKLMEIRPDDR